MFYYSGHQSTTLYNESENYTFEITAASTWSTRDRWVSILFYLQGDMDRGHELQIIRHLRDIAMTGCREAVLELCSIYAEGRFGGIPRSQATAFVRDFVQSTKPSGIYRVFQNSDNQDITHSMRYSGPSQLMNACMCIRALKNSFRSPYFLIDLWRDVRIGLLPLTHSGLVTPFGDIDSGQH